MENGLPRCLLCDAEPVAAPAISGHPMLRCRACGFVYATDRHVPPGLYDAAYTADGDYANLLASARAQLQGTGTFDWMHEWVMDRVEPFGGRRALDLGCGVGSALFLAKRAGWTPFGQDVSENATRVAREVFGVTTFNEPIDRIAGRGERFELVTCFNLIEHLPEPMPYLRTVRRLMTDDGYLGVIVPNYDSYTMRQTTERQWLPPFHLNFFTQRTLSLALEKVGLRIVEHRIKFASWSGIEGSKLKRLMLAPYLIANALVGRLRGNGIVAIARAAGSR